MQEESVDWIFVWKVIEGAGFSEDVGGEKSELNLLEKTNHICEVHPLILSLGIFSYLDSSIRCPYFSSGGYSCTSTNSELSSFPTNISSP